jgi:ubiquinone/menaquinone biosynthesis C-methylase UbiE
MSSAERRRRRIGFTKEGAFLAVKVKQYYINVERYDWIVATDHLFGVESIFHRNRERVFTRLIRQYADRTMMLDVGCGTGLLLRHMKEDAIGLDINPWNVKKAKEHTGRQIIRGDAEFLPVRSAVFDLMVCTETLEHLPDPLRALEEMCRALKQDGKVIGSVPHPHPGWRLRFLSSTHPRGEPFHHSYTRSQVAALLRSSGFRVKRVFLSLLALNTNFVGEKP